MDITKENEVVAVVERIQQKHGGVDILINRVERLHKVLASVFYAFRVWLALLDQQV